MAAAEARAAWQRTANRFFVQEDAIKAPKLACGPPSSSSSSLSKQIDTRPTINEITDPAPPSTSPSYSNLSPDSKWWLQLQPNYLHQNDLTNENVNTFVKIMDSQSTVKVDHLGEESYEFVEMDFVHKEVDEFSLVSDFPHWMESEKNHELPWWRMTDKDDLASYVALRSHNFIENCDLPSPQNTRFKRDVYARDQFPHKKDEVTTFKISTPQKHQCQNAGSPNASSGSVSPLSTQSNDNTVHEGSRTPETDSSKRKLLEALCHSQTRAREAEKAAKQAYEEKEHIVKLIFKQASQLFAYKQWVYLLQLENLYNQIKTNKMINPVFPASPWHVPRKRTHRNSPVKKRTPVENGIGVPRCKHDIGKYAVAFAVGLGLVGAGLLLGWTVGWMFI